MNSFFYNKAIRTLVSLLVCFAFNLQTVLAVNLPYDSIAQNIESEYDPEEATFLEKNNSNKQLKLKKDYELATPPSESSSNKKVLYCKNGNVRSIDDSLYGECPKGTVSKCEKSEGVNGEITWEVVCAKIDSKLSLKTVGKPTLRKKIRRLNKPNFKFGVKDPHRAVCEFGQSKCNDPCPTGALSLCGSKNNDSEVLCFDTSNKKFTIGTCKKDPNEKRPYCQNNTGYCGNDEVAKCDDSNDLLLCPGESEPICLNPGEIRFRGADCNQVDYSCNTETNEIICDDENKFPSCSDGSIAKCPKVKRDSDGDVTLDDSGTNTVGCYAVDLSKGLVQNEDIMPTCILKTNFGSSSGGSMTSSSGGTTTTSSGGTTTSSGGANLCSPTFNPVYRQYNKHFAPPNFVDGQYAHYQIFYKPEYGDLNNDGKEENVGGVFRYQHHGNMKIKIADQGFVIFYGNDDLPTDYKPIPPIGFVHLVDLNNDGFKDIIGQATGGKDNNYDGQYAIEERTKTIKIIINNSGTTFTEASSFELEKSTEKITSGDLNNDGFIDLVFSNYTPSQTSNTGIVENAIYLGGANHSYTFKTKVTTDLKSFSDGLSDFNNDGKLDLVLISSHQTPNKIYVLPGNGDGTFGAEIISDFPEGSTSRLTVGDYNGDGNNDIVTLVNRDKLLVALGKGDSTFHSVKEIHSLNRNDKLFRPYLKTINYNNDEMEDIELFVWDNDSRKFYNSYQNTTTCHPKYNSGTSTSSSGGTTTSSGGTTTSSSGGVTTSSGGTTTSSSGGTTTSSGGSNADVCIAEQWGSEVIAFSSQINPAGAHSAQAALGEADCTCHSCSGTNQFTKCSCEPHSGNYGWTPIVERDNDQFLTLGFETPTKANKVSVYVTNYLSKVRKVILTTVSNKQITVFNNFYYEKYRLTCQDNKLEVRFPMTEEKIKSVTVYTGTSQKAGIDAIKLSCDNSPLVIKNKISNIHGGLKDVIPPSSNFGTSVTSIGDFNNDGVNDLAVGAQYAPGGGNQSGEVWLLNLDNNHQVTYSKKLRKDDVRELSSPDYFRLGKSVTNIGDINNDGVNDIAVINEQYMATSNVWILQLNSNGEVIKSVTHTVYGKSSVAGIGDINADGIDDIAIGDTTVSNGRINIIFLNSEGGIKNHQEISNQEGGLEGQFDSYARYFGSSISSIGDIDNDGVNDIAVGDSGYNQNHGCVWVLLLNSDGTVKSSNKIVGNTSGFDVTIDRADLFGSSITGLGDIDNDGVEDIAVGATGDDDGDNGNISANRGAVYILKLNSDGTVKSYEKISDVSGDLRPDLENMDYFGSSLTLLDRSNIGKENLLIAGAPYEDEGKHGTELNNGALWIFGLCDGMLCMPTTSEPSTTSSTSSSGGTRTLNLCTNSSDENKYKACNGGCADILESHVWSSPTLELVDSEGTYPEVDNFCRTLNDGGFTDWRVPTADELISISAKGDSKYISLNLPSGKYWTSTVGGFNARKQVILNTGEIKESVFEKVGARVVCIRNDSTCFEKANVPQDNCHPEQWAARVISATSTYVNNSTVYSASNAVGEPGEDCSGCISSNNCQIPQGAKAWTPKKADFVLNPTCEDDNKRILCHDGRIVLMKNGENCDDPGITEKACPPPHIELDFAVPTRATGIQIYTYWYNLNLNKVELLNENNSVVATYDKNSLSHYLSCPNRDLIINFPKTSELIHRARIYTSSFAPVAIDAVKLTCGNNNQTSISVESTSERPNPPGQCHENTDRVETGEGGCKLLFGDEAGIVWSAPSNPKAPMTRQEAISYCDSLNEGGQSDWTLPNLQELEELFSSAFGASRYISLFPGTNFWSRTQVVNPWGSRDLSPTDKYSAICKREGQIFIPAGCKDSCSDKTEVGGCRIRYGLPGRDEILFSKISQPYSQTFTWHNANAYCENLVEGGISDWHLPSKALLDNGINTFCLNTFGAKKFWSSTKSGLNNAYYFDISGSSIGRVDVANTASPFRALCVYDDVPTPQTSHRCKTENNCSTGEGGCKDYETNYVVSLNKSGFDWNGAKTYCENLVEEGKNDWRLGSKEEMENLFGEEFLEHCANIPIWATYWTSDENPSLSVNAYVISPTSTYFISNTAKTSTHPQTVCIRNGNGIQKQKTNDTIATCECASSKNIVCSDGSFGKCVARTKSPNNNPGGPWCAEVNGKLVAQCCTFDGHCSADYLECGLPATPSDECNNN